MEFRHIASESQVRAMVVHPKDPRILYAGSDSGVYRTEDRGENWLRLDSPMNSGHHGFHRVCACTIWPLAIDPVDPNIIFADTCPSAIFRTKDGGLTWEKLPVELRERCANIEMARVTSIQIDPVNHNYVWAGIEVDGLRLSRDGGDSWEVVSFEEPDIHSIAITAGPPKTVVIVATRQVYLTTDDGGTFEPVDVVAQGITTCRGSVVKADDPQTIIMGNGVADYGGGAGLSWTPGSVHCSRNRGKTWERLPLPGEPNGTVWNLAAHPSDPDYVLASSVNGQVFCTADGGDSWSKFAYEFGQVNALAWVPN